MDNIKIAKQLIGMARELVGKAKFTDGLGEDSDNSNAKYNAQFEKIIRELYPDHVAKTIIMCGRNLDRSYPVKGTMGNGNIILKYVADPESKRFIIMALNSVAHHVKPSDTRDIINLYKFLKKQVEDGYVILTDCNTYSIPFLAAFAKNNGYWFNADEPRYEFGNTGDERDISRACVVMKHKPSYAPDSNADEFTKDRKNLDNTVRNLQ